MKNNCHHKETPRNEIEYNGEMKESYRITGMTCSACSSNVERVCNHINGVESVTVNLLTETMYIVYNETLLTGDEIINTVQRVEYGVELLRREGGNVEKGDTNRGNTSKRDVL